MHRGSRPRGLLGTRGRTGLASTVGPVLVGVFVAFAWNMAGSLGSLVPQHGAGLAPTVGTAVDQAADQAWASATPSTRIPDRRPSPPAGSHGVASTGCHRARSSRVVHVASAVDSADVSACSSPRRFPEARKTPSAMSASTTALSAHRRPGYSSALIVVMPTRGTRAKVRRACRWLIGARKADRLRGQDRVPALHYGCVGRRPPRAVGRWRDDPCRPTECGR